MKITIYEDGVEQTVVPNIPSLIEWLHKYHDSSVLTALESGRATVTMEDETGVYDLVVDQHGRTSFNKKPDTETNTNTETDEAEN